MDLDEYGDDAAAEDDEYANDDYVEEIRRDGTL